MLPESVLKQMVARIHTTPELAGCVVGYCGDGSCRTIGFPSSVTPNSENVAVIIEEVIPSGDASPLSVPKAGGATVTGTAAQGWAKNWTRIGAELIGTGVACGLTVSSGIGVVAAMGATAPTAGVSLAALGVLWTGFGTGAIQCANGVARVGAALYDPSLATLDGWDRNSWYAVSILLVDALGVSIGIGSLPAGVRKLWDVFTRLGAFKTANLSFDGLRRMGRVERLRTISRVFKDATQSGDGVVEIVQSAKEATFTAKTMQRATALSQKDAATIVRIIRDETVRQLHSAFTDLLATNTGLILSATPAKLTGSGSGSINWVINFIDAGQPVQ